MNLPLPYCTVVKRTISHSQWEKSLSRLLHLSKILLYAVWYFSGTTGISSISSDAVPFQENWVYTCYWKNDSHEEQI